MTQWTHSARAEMEGYFARLRASLTASGADAEEVVEDLRRHLEVEAAGLNLTVVTEDDVRRLLARIGAPEVNAPPPPAETPVAKPAYRRPGWLLLFFGVVLPVITLGLEFLTGACAAVFFDPLPNWGNVLLVAAVPLANFLVWRALRSEMLSRRDRLGLLNGVALGVAFVYSLLLLPLAPFAAIGVLYFGLGLIPLAPLPAFVTALILRRRLRLSGDAQPPRLHGTWSGAALGIAALMACYLPMILTEAGMRLAVSSDPAVSQRGIDWLRLCGQDERMLRFCYGRAGQPSNLYATWGPVSPAEARIVYYRVNGRAFNAVPPPKLYAGRGRWNALEEEFTWDDDQGGDAVAGRAKGLSLAASRLDGVIEPDAALAYLEWTLEFKNDSVLQREARAQILLPPGGVVTRLTLWVDGEEREAAFAGRAEVKAAYKAVVRQRRDPVLVSTCGPDRVMMQCYPVPPGGGRMKVRLGITAPLTLTNAGAGTLRWPHFLERNFTIREELRHSLWMESPQPIEARGGTLAHDRAPTGRPHTVRGSLSDRELATPAAALLVHRSADVEQVQAIDDRNGDPQIIWQTIATHPPAKVNRAVIVVDGTRGMREYLPAIANALAAWPQDLEVAVLLAADGVRELALPGGKDKASAAQLAAAALRSTRLTGGHDNVPALVRAWDLAAQRSNSPVVWIHGPQPILLDTAEELLQRFQRQPGNPRLIEIQTEAGPNRVVEKLDGIAAVQSAPRQGDLQADLAALVARLSGREGWIEITRRRTTLEPRSSSGPTREGSRHVVRLWAAEQVQRLRAERKLAEAAQLAASYQLVTPVSGAVVLETQRQYDQAGLRPVDPTSVPVIPEPPAWALFAVALVLGVTAAARRARR